MSFDLANYIKQQNRWKEERLYFWADHTGVPLHTPSQNKEEVLALKEEMQKKSNEKDEVISLMSYSFNERHDVVYPPPDEEELKQMRFKGGHAFGGSNPVTAEDHIKDFKYYFDRIYKGSELIKYWSEGNVANAELNGVRITLEPIPEELQFRGGEHAIKMKWKITVTNFNWGVKALKDPPKVKFTGFYSGGWEANQEAVAAFLKEQLHEEVMALI